MVGTNSDQWTADRVSRKLEGWALAYVVRVVKMRKSRDAAGVTDRGPICYGWVTDWMCIYMCGWGKAGSHERLTWIVHLLRYSRVDGEHLRFVRRSALHEGGV